MLNTLNKGTVLLLLALVIISFSGCVISEKNKTGWDWEKYEKYSEFYDKINNSAYGDSTHKAANFPGTGVSRIESLVLIEDIEVEMGGDTEFDTTWRLTFHYLKRGLEAESTARERWSNYRYGEKSYYNTEVAAKAGYKAYTSKAMTYYNQSYEYRQKIEEMKPSR